MICSLRHSILRIETRQMEIEDQEKFRLLAEREKKRNRKDSDLIDDEPPVKKQKTRKKDQEESEDSDSEEHVPMPKIDYDESIEEMRARRGGVLNQLAQSIDNEHKARKQNISKKLEVSMPDWTSQNLWKLRKTAHQLPIQMKKRLETA